MIVVATLGTAFRVAPRPHAHVHGVNRRWLTSGERMAGEQPPQGRRIDPSLVQRRVEATPPAAVGWFEAQVDRRRHHLCGKDGIAKLEERVGAALEAAVERVSEGAQDIEGFHNEIFC